MSYSKLNDQNVELFLLHLGELRLAGRIRTTYTISGRLEVYINNTWGTICDDGWDINDATVACRQLGYDYAEAARTGAYYGQGSGRIWLDDLACSGTEMSLLRCLHNGFGIHNCGHSEDAGLTCGIGMVNFPKYSHITISCRAYFIAAIINS